MYTRKMALTFARRFRSCPGPEILQKTEYEMQIDHHLSICPYCSADQFNSDRTFQTLAKKLKRPQQTESTIATTGDIRQVKPEYGVWRDGFYYHPPAVLVVDLLEQFPRHILVAQIYDDLILAGPGDLIVYDTQAGAGDFFIESWNMYLLTETHLGPALAGLDHEIVATGRTMVISPERVPRWVPLCMPMTEHDPRLYFRELEIEVGRALSDQISFRSAGGSEDPVKILEAMPPEILLNNLRRIHSGIRWRTPPETASQVLAFAQLPEHEIPLAADDIPEKSVPVICCRMEDHVFSRIFVMAARINDVMEKGREIIYAGEIKLGDNTFENSRLRAYLMEENRPEKGVCVAENISWDQEMGFFKAQFQDAFVPNHRLVLVVVDAVSTNHR